MADQRIPGTIGEVHTAAVVRDALAAALPGRAGPDLVPLGEGLDNAAYLVDGELVVRVAKGDPGRVDREGALLAVVGEVSPVAVPRPVFVDARRGCLAYPLLPGVPLLGQEPGPDVAARLGELLAALHRMPHAQVAHLVDADDVPLSEWRDAAAESWVTVAPEVPPAGAGPSRPCLPPSRRRALPIGSSRTTTWVSSTCSSTRPPEPSRG